MLQKVSSSYVLHVPRSPHNWFGGLRLREYMNQKLLMIRTLLIYSSLSYYYDGLD